MALPFDLNRTFVRGITRTNTDISIYRKTNQNKRQATQRDHHEGIPHRQLMFLLRMVRVC